MFRKRFHTRALLSAIGVGLAFGASPLTFGADTVTDADTERTALEAQYGYRVEIDSDPQLDPVVFTEIVPFTAEENAVRLPPDQDLD